MSLCITFMLCKYRTPSNTCLIYLAATGSSNLLLVFLVKKA